MPAAVDGNDCRPTKALVARQRRFAALGSPLLLRTDGGLAFRPQAAPRPARIALPGGPAQLLAFLRGDGPACFALTPAVAGWLAEEVALVRCEELVGVRGRDARDAALARLARGVFAADGAATLDIDRCLAEETLTRSDGRSQVKDWWSTEAEAKSERLGGGALASALGCR
jgi:hypothetical protein